MIDFIIENAATIGTIFFFSTFCFIVASLFKPKAKKESEKNAQIPLKDDD